MNCRMRDTEWSTDHEACPVCGHTRIMHPGAHNPALGSCALCILTRMIDDGS